MSTIDLNNPPPGHRYRVVVDREETDSERAVRLTKDVGVFLLAVVFVGAIYWLAYATVINPTAGTEEKKWAMSVLSASALSEPAYDHLDEATRRRLTQEVTRLVFPERGMEL